MLLLITKEHFRKIAFVKKTGTQVYTIKYQLQTKQQNSNSLFEIHMIFILMILMKKHGRHHFM